MPAPARCGKDMVRTTQKILVWLPSPMGDAILCTPALRALRKHFKGDRITFLARPTVREVLTPSEFNDDWLEITNTDPFAVARLLRGSGFDQAILLKNSFGSALACWLAGIPSRIGYAREGRGALLTERLYPARTTFGDFVPVPMVDYYLAVASWLGCDTDDRSLQLAVDSRAEEKLGEVLPEVQQNKGPIVVLVPGGAFGPSKCWPGERFAETADWMIENYDATVVVSVSPNREEVRTAKRIREAAKGELIDLSERPVDIGTLKALFNKAELVITNDTGPRHIAITLGRKVVTLFGPNSPTWTDTQYENEIQIVGRAPCAPCAKPVCNKKQHLCMESISTAEVCEAAGALLEDRPYAGASKPQEFIQASRSFAVDVAFKSAFEKLGVTSIDAVFSFNGGLELTKNNLARYRSRKKLVVDCPAARLYLKRYDHPPAAAQLKNWLAAGKKVSCAFFDYTNPQQLRRLGINAPKVVCFGEEWGLLFEERSFCITEEIPNAQSLEKKLPDCFAAGTTTEKLKAKRDFIGKLADIVRRFHQSGYRHRDLYLSHIFHDEAGRFWLIDLARTFKPSIFSERFRVKDIAQLHYSAPGRYFSQTDRMRFYKRYSDGRRLSRKDKAFIRRVLDKANRIARHDRKHGRSIPFEN